MDNICLPWVYPMGGISNEKKLEEAWTSSKFVVERKFDGIRGLLRHELDGTTSLTSRTKSVRTGLPVNKIDNVPHLSEMIKSTKLGTIIDGEIITTMDCTSTDVQEIMGSLPEKAIDRQKKNGFVNFIAYDILYYNGEDLTGMPWDQRRKTLEYVVEKEIGLEHPNLFLSVYYDCDKFDTKKWFAEILSMNGEGVILKNRKAKYQAGTDKMKKPANTFLKAKKNDTYDVIITGYIDAEKDYEGKEIYTWKYWQDAFGNKLYLNGQSLSDVYRLTQQVKIYPVTKYHFNNWIGSISLSQYDKDGSLVEVGSTSGFDDETRKYISEHKKELLGAVMEIGGMERIAKTNAIRHPFFIRLREDKQAKECIIE